MIIIEIHNQNGDCYKRITETHENCLRIEAHFTEFGGFQEGKIYIKQDFIDAQIDDILVVKKDNFIFKCVISSIEERINELLEINIVSRFTYLKKFYIIKDFNLNETIYDFFTYSTVVELFSRANININLSKITPLKSNPTDIYNHNYNNVTLNDFLQDIVDWDNYDPNDPSPGARTICYVDEYDDLVIKRTDVHFYDLKESIDFFDYDLAKNNEEIRNYIFLYRNDLTPAFAPGFARYQARNLYFYGRKIANYVDPTGTATDNQILEKAKKLEEIKKTDKYNLTIKNIENEYMYNFGKYKIRLNGEDVIEPLLSGYEVTNIFNDKYSRDTAFPLGYTLADPPGTIKTIAGITGTSYANFPNMNIYKAKFAALAIDYDLDISVIFKTDLGTTCGGTILVRQDTWHTYEFDIAFGMVDIVEIGFRINTKPADNLQLYLSNFVGYFKNKSKTLEVFAKDMSFTLEKDIILCDINYGTFKDKIYDDVKRNREYIQAIELEQQLI